jgi:hypothetical protein
MRVCCLERGGIGDDGTMGLDQATAGRYPSLRRAVVEIDEGRGHTRGVNQHDVMYGLMLP